MTRVAVASALWLIPVALLWRLGHILLGPALGDRLPAAVERRSQVLRDLESPCGRPDPITRASGSRSEGEGRTWPFLGPSYMLGNVPGDGHVKKKAFQRAVRRAKRDGGTWYRNQWLTSPVRDPLPDQATWHPLPKVRVSKRARTTILSWNAGSLCQELWLEIQQYAHTHKFDLMAIQSTGWSFTSQWRVPGYTAIHSGSTSRYQDGVMLLISDRIAASEQISVSEIIPGRLLHVRLKQQEQSLDYLLLYQHPWRNTLSQLDNLAIRQQVWDALHECLTRMPFRNQLILSGDFNATVLNNNYPDNKQLRHILNHHGLTTLLQTQIHHPTYFSAQGNTQIDYIFCRTSQVDAQAKRGFVDAHSPLGSWRDAQDHKPLIASITRSWLPWRRKPAQLTSAVKTRDDLISMQRTSPQNWQHLCQTLSAQTTSLETQLRHLHAIHDIAREHIASQTVPRAPGLGLDPGGLVRQMWEQHALLIRSASPTLRQVFEKWQHWCQLKKLRKQVRTTNRQRKREAMQQTIQEAAEAFRSHDPYKMYRVVRKIAPKTPYQTVHLRSKAGLAQDPEQELQEIANFLAELCRGQEYAPPTGTLDEMPFTCQELEHALRCTPSTKSVAPDSCPGILVKHTADEYAPWLFEALKQMWLCNESIKIPHRWKAAWVICIPKRHISTPRDIRPIALQCPIGKAVLRAIVRKAQEFARPALQPYPVYAYTRPLH